MLKFDPNAVLTFFASATVIYGAIKTFNAERIKRKKEVYALEEFLRAAPERFAKFEDTLDKYGRRLEILGGIIERGSDHEKPSR